jgi:hypothetical protein
MPTTTLQALRDAGCTVSLDGGKLKISGAGTLTSDLRTQVAAHRDGLVALLESETVLRVTLMPAADFVAGLSERAVPPPVCALRRETPRALPTEADLVDRGWSAEWARAIRWALRQEVPAGFRLSPVVMVSDPAVWRDAIAADAWAGPRGARARALMRDVTAVAERLPRAGAS